MPLIRELTEGSERVGRHGGLPRFEVGPQAWTACGQALARGDLTLLGLWGEGAAVHLALFDEAGAEAAILTLACPERRYPSIGRLHPPAIRLERAAQDLFGLVAEGAADARPWLDHGRWGIRAPLAEHPQAAPEATEPYAFLAAEGEGLHQVPVGPVHAGVIEPGHFRFHASGETVVRLEERLGYAHKGIEGLMTGAELDDALRLAARTSGDSAVAYALAFSRAAESALGIGAPDRAVWLRALMAELERLANHLGDIGAICNDASFPLMLAHCAVLRERVLRAAGTAFGHRLMRDRIVPGGVAADLGPEGRRAIGDLVAGIRSRFPELVELYDNTTSLQDRTVGTGVLVPALARQFGAGGYVGRASGRAFDARRAFRYPPYERLSFEVPVLQEGDVNARVWVRIREVEQSLSLVERIVEELPAGPLRTELPRPREVREGVALVEAFRGDLLVWLRLREDGTVGRCHMRDASWFLWPVLEAAIEGNIVADFPLCNKSFNCSYSGHDL
jgi:Ni,Fe-hydrogenase III large subunit